MERKAKGVTEGFCGEVRSWRCLVERFGEIVEVFGGDLVRSWGEKVGRKGLWRGSVEGFGKVVEMFGAEN